MTQPDAPGNPVQVKIELDPRIAEGVYVNMALVNQTETEFTLDCIYVQPQEPKGTVRARVITSPRHAKRLLAALRDAVANWEQRFGPLDVEGGGSPPSGGFFN